MATAVPDPAFPGRPRTTIRTVCTRSARPPTILATPNVVVAADRSIRRSNVPSTQISARPKRGPVAVVIVAAVPRNRNEARAPATPLATYLPPTADAAISAPQRAAAPAGARRVPLTSAIASTPVPTAPGCPGPAATMLTCSVWGPRRNPVKVRGTTANDGRYRSIVVRYLPSIWILARPKAGPATVQRVTVGPENPKVIEAPTRRSHRYDPPITRASSRAPQANDDPDASSETAVAARKLASVFGRGFAARSTIAGVAPFGFATTT